MTSGMTELTVIVSYLSKVGKYPLSRGELVTGVISAKSCWMLPVSSLSLSNPDKSFIKKIHLWHYCVVVH
jgi:hypothetical protein